MADKRALTFTSSGAKAQYIVLMGLFRLAFLNRYLFGIFTRTLARFCVPENAVYLSLSTGGQFKIYLNDAYWTRFALYRDDYELEVGAVIQKAQGHANVFCDLGANKGYWSVFAAPLFGKVFAVEASSATFKILTENTISLSNVSRRWAAIYVKSDEELSFVNVHNSHASARLGDDAGLSDNTETVQTIAIDDLLPAKTIALIKLDVEGAEISAIDGAKRTLLDGSVLIYEDHGSDTACAPSAHLLSLPGIRVYSVQNGLKRLHSVDEVLAQKGDKYTGYNFLAGHKDSDLLTGILEGFAKP
ncbi:MAG: FkbM family methyltransferase [Pseudomonadota bacterium]